MKQKRLRRVYVWELPVRITHWVVALCIVSLCITGYLIANPIAIQSSLEAYESYWFGTTRFIHFVSAYVLLAALIVRTYWAFVGNKYANWRSFLPLNVRFFRRLLRVLRIDIFLLKGKDYVAVGHNALAGFSYFFLFILIVLMFITGFGLYADITTWWLPKSFRWVQDLFGGDHMVREVHHICMWLFLVFIVIHLYLVLYHDQFEARGETSSMMSGYKFMEEEIFEELEQSKEGYKTVTKHIIETEIQPSTKSNTEESPSDNEEPRRRYSEETLAHHGDRKSSDG